MNTETARTGARSARVGRNGESNTITFNPVIVAGYANVQLSLYHYVHPVGALPGTNGEGMDTDEGAVIQVRLNGGAWVTQGRVSGFSNASWGWANTGGSAFGGCMLTLPNPFVYNAPAGTNTIAVRVFSTKGGCPGGVAGNYDRTDEGFFIDDVRLTTTSPVVTPGGGTVTWAGSVDTDWFNCRNWDPQVVPGPLWNVIIDQTSSNQCVIGVNGTVPMDAFAATVIVRSNNTTNRTLTVNLARSLTVGGLVTVQRTASTGQLGIIVQNGSFTSGGLTLVGTAATTNQALFRNLVATNNVQINGNVTIDPGGRLELQGTPGGTLGLTGNLSNNEAAASFPKTGSLVVLNGNGPQALTSIAAGTGEPYASLRVAKPAGDVTLNSPASVANVLDLQQGRINTTMTQLLNLQATSSVINVSNASFVNGPVRKRGNTNFTFPVGKDVWYRPISITSPGGNAALFFTAEYFQGDPTVVFGTPMDPTLDHVSLCEWWILDRSSTQTPIVTLSWDATSCGVTDLADLHVAEWYLGQWRDRGNGGTTGDVLTGTVRTAAPQAEFNAPTPWTLASISAENPLPIELISFTAGPYGTRVLAEWETATERNCERFDVERSADGIGDFTRVGTLPGAGTTYTRTSYELIDPYPLRGWSYYRLRQTDFDGTSSVSHIVPVYFAEQGNIVIRTDPSGVVAFHDHPPGSTYALYDAIGRLLLTGITVGDGILVLGPMAMERAYYVLRISNAMRSEVVRFVY